MAQRSHKPATGLIFSLLLGTAVALQSPIAVSQTASPTGSPASLQEQITQHEQKLAAAHAAGSKKDEYTELDSLGGLHLEAGQTQKALDYYNQALQSWRKVSSRNGEALSLDGIGRVYSDMGQTDKALDYYNQALPIWRETSNQRGEALTLNNIGRVYSDLGQGDKALDYLNKALPIWRTVNNPRGAASTLDNIGKVYADLSQKEKALDYFNQALPLWREAQDRPGEALTLSNLGNAYSDLGEKQKALDLYNQAMPIWRATGDRRGESSTLNYIGKTYSDLGQQPKALDFYNQALTIWRAVGDRSGEALTLSYIGRASFFQGDTPKALDFYNQALPLWREVGYRRGQALDLDHIGRALASLGQYDKAIEFYYQALALWREAGEHSGEAATLTNIGLTYDALKQSNKALPNEVAALSLATAVGDPNLLGNINVCLMHYFRGQGRPEVAIFFGMDAVNWFQQVRRNLSGLDADLQESFTQSRSGAYRQLAELLVQTDRLAEAEHVLDLLKEQELKEVVRGATGDPAAKADPLPLTVAQQSAQGELATPEKTAMALTDVSAEYGALLAKPSRSSAEDARLKQLDARIEAGNTEVSAFFKNTLYPELAQRSSATDANALLSKEKSDISRLQNTLADLGQRVLGIRLLLGADHAYAIVITPRSREKVELGATPDELRSKVLQVRDELRSPSSNPKPHLTELYTMVIAPLEPELRALEAQPKALEAQPKPTGAQSAQAHAAVVPTLLWSLDGVLRYIPIAALYDGTHYMVERFNNVLFTPESYGHMAAPSAADNARLRVLAMGLSKSYAGLPALPGVLPELEAVVHDPAVPASHGPMNGLLLPNDQFTLAALKTELGSGSTFPVVHIASHFIVEAGAGEEPYLMLGGDATGDAQGYALTLSKIEDSPISFHGTRLLTLSACSTAKGDTAQDGLEMDSLGMIAQQKDAEAVLATLWDVADESTSRLMSDFYARWVKQPADGKAEALRQAQLALLQSSPASTQGPNPANFAHPFYWAPFVLIGNFQ
jgi:CHAT domain-containing protein/Tfp pilus assembly protein PilF